MGTISVEIDKITECLIDVNTGKEVKTIVTQIKHTSTGYAYTIVLWEDAARRIKEAYDYEKRY
jgi:hypothetical protein